MIGVSERFGLASAVLAAASIACAPSAAARDEAIVLQPNVPWTMDYADDSCALRRTFANEEAMVYLEMRQFSPSKDEIQFIVGSPQLRTKHRHQSRDVQVRFVPDAEPGDVGLNYNMNFESGMNGLTFSRTLFPPELWQRFMESGGDTSIVENYDPVERSAEITAMEFINVFRDPVTIDTGSLGPPMEAMRDCLDELLTHWDIDAEAHKNLMSLPAPRDIQNWVEPILEVYPRTSARRGEQAILRIRLNVSAEGRATACHMQSRLGQEEFEHVACELLLEHSRFDPAIGSDGEPMDSYHLMTVNYQIGRR